MKENKLILEFIKNVYADNFVDAEKTLRSIVEEKIKGRMKKQMETREEEKE